MAKAVVPYVTITLRYVTLRYVTVQPGPDYGSPFFRRSRPYDVTQVYGAKRGIPSYRNVIPAAAGCELSAAPCTGAVLHLVACRLSDSSHSRLKGMSGQRGQAIDRRWM